MILEYTQSLPRSHDLVYDVIVNTEENNKKLEK